MATYKGKFVPKNPQKYVGDVKKIVYRSSWERAYFRYCDEHENIINWASEEVVVPYISPVDGKVHRYFIDVWIRYKAKDGTEKTKLIEIKPASQTRPPKVPKRKTPRYMNQVKTWVVNNAKWESAQKFAHDKGSEFVILTENHLCHISSAIKPEKKRR